MWAGASASSRKTLRTWINRVESGACAIASADTSRAKLHGLRLDMDNESTSARIVGTGI